MEDQSWLSADEERSLVAANRNAPMTIGGGMVAFYFLQILTLKFILKKKKATMNNTEIAQVQHG
jgi:TRAP-type C4-dicarboxylate transport system permease small subunit